jgi:hypothetical protein
MRTAISSPTMTREEEEGLSEKFMSWTSMRRRNKEERIRKELETINRMKHNNEDAVTSRRILRIDFLEDWRIHRRSRHRITNLNHFLFRFSSVFIIRIGTAHQISKDSSGRLRVVVSIIIRRESLSL